MGADFSLAYFYRLVQAYTSSLDLGNVHFCRAVGPKTEIIKYFNTFLYFNTLKLKHTPLLKEKSSLENGWTRAQQNNKLGFLLLGGY